MQFLRLFHQERWTYFGPLATAFAIQAKKGKRLRKGSLQRYANGKVATTSSISIVYEFPGLLRIK